MTDKYYFLTHILKNAKIASSKRKSENSKNKTLLTSFGKIIKDIPTGKMQFSNISCYQDI